MAWTTPSSQVTGDLITAAIWNQNIVSNPIALLPVGVDIIIDGGGAPIEAGSVMDVEVPAKLDLTSVRLVADQTGCMVVDIYKTAYAALPPAVASSICGDKPTLTAASKMEDTSLSGWTTDATAGDWWRISVSSNTCITKATLSLRGNRS